MKIKVGDEVVVITGKREDKGKRGEVIRVLPKESRVVVSGVNLVKKHQKPVAAGRGRTQGGIIEFEAPIHVSNVMLVCPDTKQPTRIGIRRDEDGNRVRYSKKSGNDIR